MRLRYFEIDAFTDRPYSGNPAAVVLLDGPLPDERRQRIAREFNLSETAFLEILGDRVGISWFTPVTEVKMCGHATLASLCALATAGLIQPGRVRLVTRYHGVLPAEVSLAEGRFFARFGLPLYAPLEVSTVSQAELAGLLGLEPPALGPEPILISAGAEVLFIPVSGLAAMRALRPDFRALAEAQPGGVAVVSFETHEGASSAFIRVLAPAEGIDEDPVTGFVQSPLAQYLYAVGRLAEGINTYRIEQGDLLGRAGRIAVEARFTANAIAAVTVGGTAVVNMEGLLRVD